MSQLYVDIYPLLLEPPSHPSVAAAIYVIAEHRAELPALHSSFPLAVLHVLVCASLLLLQSVPPSPSLLCSPVQSLHMCLCSALWRGSPVPFFWILYICVNMWYLFFPEITSQKYFWHPHTFLGLYFGGTQTKIRFSKVIKHCLQNIWPRSALNN